MYLELKDVLSEIKGVWKGSRVLSRPVSASDGSGQAMHLRILKQKFPLLNSRDLLEIEQGV